MIEITEQEFAQAKETCDRAAVQLQGFEAASKVLASIGSLKGMVKSLTKQKEDAEQALAAVQKNLDETMARTKITVNECAKLRDQTQADVDHALKEAKANAAKIVAEASERAGLDLANAKKEHANELVVVKSEIAKAKKELETLSGHIKAAIDAEALALKKKHEAEQALADLQARASRLAAGG